MSDQRLRKVPASSADSRPPVAKLHLSARSLMTVTASILASRSYARGHAASESVVRNNVRGSQVLGESVPALQKYLSATCRLSPSSSLCSKLAGAQGRRSMKGAFCCLLSSAPCGNGSPRCQRTRDMAVGREQRHAFAACPFRFVHRARRPGRGRRRHRSPRWSKQRRRLSLALLRRCQRQSWPPSPPPHVQRF